MHTIERVREFHLAFGHPVEDEVTVPDAKTRLLRFNLLFEEVMEYGRAIGIEGLCEPSQEDFESELKASMSVFEINPTALINTLGAADALADIDYVCAGANLCHGFPAENVAIEVHRSNMSKLGEDGNPMLAENGKIIKGPNYFPPDIASVLFAQRRKPTNIEELYEMLTKRFHAVEGTPRAWMLVERKTGEPVANQDQDNQEDIQRVVYRVYGARTDLEHYASLYAYVYDAVAKIAPYSGARMYWRRRPTLSFEEGEMRLTLRIGFHNWGEVASSCCEVLEGELPKMVQA
jgi:predicted HAD superfamily Cof-like phosphohydrolase